MIQSHTQPKYLEMLENPTLREYIRGIMGWKSEILLERTMIRHNAPGALSTGIHYDKIFLRKGESEFLTAWVPIGKIHLIDITRPSAQTNSINQAILRPKAAD